MKLGTSIHHVNGLVAKVFKVRGQQYGKKSKRMTGNSVQRTYHYRLKWITQLKPNNLLVLRTASVWRGGSLVFHDIWINCFCAKQSSLITITAVLITCSARVSDLHSAKVGFKAATLWITFRQARLQISEEVASSVAGALKASFIYVEINATPRCSDKLRKAFRIIVIYSRCDAGGHTTAWHDTRRSCGLAASRRQTQKKSWRGVGTYRPARHGYTFGLHCQFNCSTINTIGASFIIIRTSDTPRTRHRHSGLQQAWPSMESPLSVGETIASAFFTARFIQLNKSTIV